MTHSIPNPHEGSFDPKSNDTLVTARLSRPIYAHLFQRTFPGYRGLKQTLICIFFDALYKECLRLKLPENFDETNVTKLSALLDNLNFRSDNIGTLLLKFPNGFTVEPDGSVVERKPKLRRPAGP